MATGLFAIDLATLTKCADPDAKRRLLGALVELFIVAHETCSPDDAAALGKLMAELIFDLDQELRAEFAVRLANCATAPRELIVQLANDRIAVARPVLAASGALTADDLIEIAQTQSHEHLLALSVRSALPQSVTAQLILRGARPAILRAIGNPDADLSPACRAALDRHAALDFELRMALEIRDGLIAGGEVREDARAHDEPQPGLGEDEVLVLSDESAAPEEDDGGIRPFPIRESDLLAATRARRLEDALRMFAGLTGQRESQITSLFRNADVGAIATLCRRAGVSGLTFEATAELCLHLSEAPPYRVLGAIQKNRSAF